MPNIDAIIKTLTDAEFALIEYQKDGEPPTKRVIECGRINRKTQTLDADQLYPDAADKTRKSFKLDRILRAEAYVPPFAKEQRAPIPLQELGRGPLVILRYFLRDDITIDKTEWVAQAAGRPDYLDWCGDFVYAYSFRWLANGEEAECDTKGELRQSLKDCDVDLSQVEFVKARDWAKARLALVDSLVGD